MKIFINEETVVKTIKIRHYQCNWCGLIGKNKGYINNHEAVCDKNPFINGLANIKTGDIIIVLGSNKKKFKNLTIGKEYEVVDLLRNRYFIIIGDNGKKHRCCKMRSYWFSIKK